MKDTWNAVDSLIERRLVHEDEQLRATVAASATAGLPPIAVSPAQGKLLGMLAQMISARFVLEVGTLGGYSGIWLARALAPRGKLTTLELSEKHAAVARASFARAGVADRVDVRVGNALETLPKLASEGLPPFDLTFIDADKVGNAAYFDWAVKLSRPGAVIVVDNVVRDGKVADAATEDANARGVQRLFEAMEGDARVDATAIQTVGVKGYDGFAVAIVK